MARTMAPDAGEMADGSAGVRSTLCARVDFAVGAIGVDAWARNCWDRPRTLRRSRKEDDACVDDKAANGMCT